MDKSCPSGVTFFAGEVDKICGGGKGRGQNDYGRMIRGQSAVAKAKAPAREGGRGGAGRVPLYATGLRAGSPTNADQRPRGQGDCLGTGVTAGFAGSDLLALIRCVLARQGIVLYVFDRFKELNGSVSVQCGSAVSDLE